VFKLSIIQKLYNLVCACIGLSVVLYLLDFFLMVSDSRDKNWRSEWIRESCWLWIFTIFMVFVIIILKPDERSDLLSSMDEIIDDKTDAPTVDGHDETMEDGIEMH